MTLPITLASFLEGGGEGGLWTRKKERGEYGRVKDRGGNGVVTSLEE